MHYLRILAITSTFASCIIALPHDRREASGLNAAAKAAGKLYFGTATDAGLWKDTAYDKILDDLAEFGQLTPENSMKWGHTEPQQGKFDYSAGDALVQPAEKTGKILRCHTLVWHGNVPSWISEGTWTKETLTAVVKNHVTNVASHFKGRCHAWDVVNEALNQDGTYRESIFYKIIGPDFIPIAFAAAAAADPGAKLYYNDYGIEVIGEKSNAARNLVQSLKAQGIKISGVGLQSHFGVGGATPSLEAQRSNMEAFTALGVEVALTELDIHMTLPATPAKLETQKGNYRDTVSACVQVKGCVGVTVWGFADKYSWISRAGGKNGAACVWDEQLQKKPAYSGIMDAFGGALAAPPPYRRSTPTDSSTKGPAKPPGQMKYSPESTTTPGHRGPPRTFTTAHLTTLTTRTSTEHRIIVEHPTGSATTDSGPDATAPAPSNSGGDAPTPTTTNVSPPATTHPGADSTPPAPSNAGPSAPSPAPTSSSLDTPATTPAPCAAPSTVTVSTDVTVTITYTPSAPHYPPPHPTTTHAPKSKKGRGPCSKKATSTKPAAATRTGGGGHSGAAKHWEECGGQGWTGPTTCEKPWTCRRQAGNWYYSQCL